MGIRNWFKEKTEIIDYTPLGIEETFKGEVENKTIKFPVQLGEEHPFDFAITEGLYKKEGFITAVVDKYVDYIVGPGFYVECEEERGKEIIEQFNKDVNMDTQLRSWIKEALLKGNGNLELGGGPNETIQGMKLLNANHMYVQRNDFGEVEGYKQYTGAFKKFDKQKVIDFKPYEIAHLKLSTIGDSAYGYGIVYSALATVNNMLKSEKDLHMLMNRKANAPYHIKLGGVFGNKYYKPASSDVAKIGKELEYQTNKLDWTTDGLTEIKVIDFGNIGEKFDAVLKYDQEKLFYIFQIPAVIMGMANIPEGLAQVQMDAFERRIKSIQAEVEKIIENQIYKRVLNSNDFDVHVEFQWGEPSNTQKMERLLKLKELMSNLRISDSLFKLMEQDVVQLLEYDIDEYEIMSTEEERKREEERQQPLVPGQNGSPPQKPLPKSERPPQPKPKEILKDKIIEEFVKKVGNEWCVFSHQTGKNFGCYPSKEQADKRLTQIKRFSKERYELKERCPHCMESWENINDLKEWLGFNYVDYLMAISVVIKKDDFINLAAESDIEERAGYFSPQQVNELKRVMNTGFVKGKSIREITRDIDVKVSPNDLFEINDEGNLGKLVKNGKSRSIVIARTEITRLANLGAIKHFKEGGIKNVRWVASVGERTCPICEGLNGQIFEINKNPGIPAHVMCRCTLVPVTELG